MPAAKPSKATMTSALDAIVAAGLTPGVLIVGPDGSFQIEIGQSADGPIAHAIAANDNGPEKFGDLT